MITAFRSALLLSRAILVCACIITPTLVTAADYYLHKGTGDNNNSGTQPDDAPVGLSGWVHGLPGGDEGECGGRMTRRGQIEEVRDFRCELWMGTTDPRFTGRYILTANYDTYHEVAGALEGGRLAVWSVIRRVENDDGAWAAAPTVTAWWLAEADDGGTVTQGERTIPIEPITFLGEGDYEGLAAIVWLNPFIVNSQLWGVVFEGEPPPAPTESG